MHQCATLFLKRPSRQPEGFPERPHSANADPGRNAHKVYLYRGYSSTCLRWAFFSVFSSRVTFDRWHLMAKQFTVLYLLRFSGALWILQYCEFRSSEYHATRNRPCLFWVKKNVMFPVYSVLYMYALYCTCTALLEHSSTECCTVQKATCSLFRVHVQNARRTCCAILHKHKKHLGRLLFSSHKINLLAQNRKQSSITYC
jgi:hypothetical protein